MTRTEFVESVTKGLMRLGYSIDQDDLPGIERGSGRLFDRGWSVEDAIKWTSCLEEVNPDLEEERALRLMKAVSDKYKKSG